MSIHGLLFSGKETKIYSKGIVLMFFFSINPALPLPSSDTIQDALMTTWPNRTRFNFYTERALNIRSATSQSSSVSISWTT
jgi:hypothetical protein